MTEYVTVPVECLHRIPTGVSMEEAALTEPACVALGAVERASFCPGETIVIFGPGPIGLLILQMCKALGAGHVFVIGLEADGKRLEVARRLGATDTLIGTDRELVQRVVSLSDGLGAGVVFEASGAPAAADLGLQMLRKTGELILVGIYAEHIALDATSLVVRAMRTIKGAYGAASLDWDRVLNLAASKRIDLKPLISEVMPLEHARQALQAACRRDALKILLKPS
jgi:L-iditol 2-dehydrogenase